MTQGPRRSIDVALDHRRERVLPLSNPVLPVSNRPEAVSLWKPLDMLRLWGNSISDEDPWFTVRVGYYATSHGVAPAVEVYDSAGMCEFKLTINLPNHPQALGEIFVHHEAGPAILEDAGVIEYTGRTVSYGPYDSVAEVWRLRKCSTHQTPPVYCSQCAVCGKQWDEEFRAKSAAYRLGGWRAVAALEARMVKEVP